MTGNHGRRAHTDAVESIECGYQKKRFLEYIGRAGYPGLNLTGLCRTKLSGGISDAVLNSFCSIFGFPPMSPRVSHEIDVYRYVARNEVVHGIEMNSLISWISVLLSVPLVESAIQYCLADDELPRSIVHEYSETERFRELSQDATARHVKAGRGGEDFVIVALADYVDGHEVFKGSKKAFMFTILNMKRRVRSIPFLHLLLAELSSDISDLYKVCRCIFLIMYNKNHHLMPV